MNFDVETTTKGIISFIKDYYQKNHVKGAVIGLSGGKDSAVCLALMKEAIGSKNILGLWLPANSSSNDKKDAYELAELLSIELKEFDLSKYTDSFVNDLKEANNVCDNDLKDVIINLKPRLRMTISYSYAAMMSKLKGGTYLVVGTSNKSERFVGYFTKGGDGVSDIAPIADLYVDEIVQIGDYLGLPYHITHKTPDDGLSEISDEEKLGFTYDAVKKICNEVESKVIDKTVTNSIRKKILDKHEANLHKFITPMYKKNGKKKIGVFMGSFNPPHKGHIKVINYLLDNNYVDKVLVVPTLNYWDKQNLAPITDRINMLKFYENDKIIIDDKNNKYIYTYELVNVLKKEYPFDELVVIMGSDNAINLKKWKNYQELLNNPIIVMNRNNIDVSCLKRLNGNFTIINDYPYIDISSTEIRENLSNKYLDDEILNYIKEKELY